MSTKPAPLPPLEYYPVTLERWLDLEELFGKRGASGGCWCMWWRLKRSEFARQAGQGNKQALKAIVDSGAVPGLLAYAEGQPVAWCSMGPREAYPVLDRSRTLTRIDNVPVWSVVCFFVARPFRGRGIMVPLLRAAVEYAKERGAKVVEGYPVEPEWARLSGSSSFSGVISAFRKAGFVEVLRRSAHRPIMRYVVRG